MIKFIHAFSIIILFYTYETSAYKVTNRPPDKNLSQQKILIFSYGSLVKQKDNKKTGALLHATPFAKSPIKLPVSFTFIAGLPPYLLHTNKKKWNNFPHRRATVTIDRLSKENKPLWFATSKMSSLSEARNNLAAREGAPLNKITQEYEVTHIFYIKKVDNAYKKGNNEKWIPGFKNWVALRAVNRRQQLSIQQLQQLVTFTIKQNADAAVWVALPSNVTQDQLYRIIEKDDQFRKSTAEYMQKMPPNNEMSNFEQKVMSLTN